MRLALNMNIFRQFPDFMRDRIKHAGKVFIWEREGIVLSKSHPFCFIEIIPALR